jgi:hypothetical protein
MLANLSPEDHSQIESFYQAAYNSPKAVALREELRPLIREHLQQAHETLGLVIEACEPGSGIPGIVACGYEEQHNEHMAKARELMKQLMTRTLEIIQKEQQ